MYFKVKTLLSYNSVFLSADAKYNKLRQFAVILTFFPHFSALLSVILCKTCKVNLMQ